MVGSFSYVGKTVHSRAVYVLYKTLRFGVVNMEYFAVFLDNLFLWTLSMVFLICLCFGFALHRELSWFMSACWLINFLSFSILRFHTL